MGSNNSLLPNTITKYGMPLGKVNPDTGEVTISKDWYLYFYQLYISTIAGGFSTQDGVIADSSEIDQGPVLSFNGITGSQTATFTASNKPGTGTTTPDKWIAVPINGVIHYIPAWL